MKTGFYPKLAWTGIKKNRKIYLPYLLTCVGMVMMFYIITYLTKNEEVASMPGGDEMQMILSFGSGVIAIFSLIFLFYTHSFLIRRRKKEFGLYNILGMGKRNLARILIWESFIIVLIALSGGLLCGILFSKAAELCMAHMLGGKINFLFSIEMNGVMQTLILFSAIFLVILLYTLYQIRISKPVELLHSDTVGEKPPKGNWFFALLGAGILAGAYYIAITIDEPITALFWFFIAVVMVIIATYLLFIAGSVYFCKLLQKRKGYYYKTNHFISISSMVYRMKRNGAGLGSICILSTIVLVMISSTFCLYIGEEDSLRKQYPRNIAIDTYSVEPEHINAVQQVIDNVLQQNDIQAKNILNYRYLDISGYFKQNQVILDQSKISSFQLSGFESVKLMYFIPLEDYNRLMNDNKTLSENEVLIYCNRSNYEYDTITIEGCQEMKVKEILTEFLGSCISTSWSLESIFIIMPDIDSMKPIFIQQEAIYGENSSYEHYYYGFDLNCKDKRQITVYQNIVDAVEELGPDNGFPSVIIDSAANEKDRFLALYGGLFFLGILLGIVFVLAAVLIMYYKQISEGYEDQSRFEIMQKVGMTKKEIRRSINSQVLTVFFLPLLAAGLHIAFAFPVISKLLILFNVTNTKLLICVTAVCYLVFTLFYVLVYRITSGAYYGIVSGKESMQGK